MRLPTNLLQSLEASSVKATAKTKGLITSAENVNESGLPCSIQQSYKNCILAHHAADNVWDVALLPHSRILNCADLVKMISEGRMDLFMKLGGIGEFQENLRKPENSL